MTLHFTKMHGLGNDFIIMDATQQPLLLTPHQIASLARRDTGIGFDQCLVVEKSLDEDVDFVYRIFNANGQEVGQCGNGARCLARFVERQELTHKKKLRIKTATITMDVQLHADDSVTVDFGTPRLQPEDIPIQSTIASPWYTLTLHDKPYAFHAINVGNPHAVLLVDALEQTDVTTLGQQLSTHPFFPEQTNVGFLQIINPHHIALRVYERGCGETQACGSGAVAAVAVGILHHHLARSVTVSLPGGELNVSWPSPSGSLFLRGPATFVYDGTLTELTT